jgi:LPXTG-motif cell wall-anchored protein
MLKLACALAATLAVTEWAMILMGMALAGAAALTLHRRRQVL